VDLINKMARTPEQELRAWNAEHDHTVQDMVTSLAKLRVTKAAGVPIRQTSAPRLEPAPTREALAETVRPRPEPVERTSPAVSSTAPKPELAQTNDAAQRVLRVTPERLNRLLGFAGESLVESRRLAPFADSLLRLKRLQTELSRTLDGLREVTANGSFSDLAQNHLQEAQGKAAACRQLLGERLSELEAFDRRFATLTNSLYHEALSCRMRPFSDGIQGFPRMVRDLAHALGKAAKLEIVGSNTQVDRDVLQKLEAPLTHLLQNAVDHGLESPDERQRSGKPATGVIRLEAHHSAGHLSIVVSDDGRGIDLESLRTAVVRRGLTSESTAAQLSEAELLEFLYLPGFSLKENVTEVSGRGVGLDVVQSMLKTVRGTVRSSTQVGNGTRFYLQLPLTLSVMRALLVDIAGEPYAFPLVYLVRALKVCRTQIQSLEGCHHFELDGRHIGLVGAGQLLEKDVPNLTGESSAVVIVANAEDCYGLVVDRLLGERELVVHPLDPRLGKLPNISAAALMEDGSPALILDVEDLLRSIAKRAGGGGLRWSADAAPRPSPSPIRKRKCVLVVDDSLTVRELERKLLVAGGYEVELAVDGVDGWNAARAGKHSLIITDIDMPRMDGIELVAQLKRDPRLRSIPTLIVSYKDREEDRRRGLEAGADYYLTKGSFQSDTLLAAVRDLIGEAA
jgi:two-component system sensor histidine kinase and response regulator WspE